MRLKNLFFLLSPCKMYVKPLVFPYRYPQFNINCIKRPLVFKKCVSTSAPQNIHRQDATDSEDDEDTISIGKYTKRIVQDGYARDLIFRGSKDYLLNRIYDCASVEEVFHVFHKHSHNFRGDHIAQTVFVLNDLMKIYGELSTTRDWAEKQEAFRENLHKHLMFQRLLKLAEHKIYLFDTTVLSYCVLYFNRLGLSVENSTMQLLCRRLKNQLLHNFCISSASRFLETAFSEYNLRSYFMSQELIPLVFSVIDSCNSAETLKDLSVCLNKLHNIVTEETLNKYKSKVESLIKNESLKLRDHKTILQIIGFLNYPKWREKNAPLTSQCMLLIQDSLNRLNVEEIILLYEIFFKLQEPGAILNNLQRCCYKFFHEMEDVPTVEKITLFSSILFFTSRHRQNEYRDTLKKYVRDCNNCDSFILLGKLLSYIKVSDIKLCHFYWDKALKFINENENCVKFSDTYVNFSTDGDTYRHEKFEEEMTNSLRNLAKEINYMFFPQKLASILNFVLLYGKDDDFLEYLVSKMEKNWEQLRPLDCLKLSNTLKLFNGMDQKFVRLPYARRVNRVLDNIINKEITNIDHDLWKSNSLLKSCVNKNRLDEPTMNKLLHSYKHFDSLSSKNIENIYYCFLVTNTLIPEILENVIKYILTYKNHVLGFNVGRVIYLCYCLGYYPKNLDDFCDTTVDIIIRDQKRMTGLSMIYSSLALCFFNKLPNSLIKSIFNVEFMDKLDDELQQCYYKDKYPQRVRAHLMQLNRAVGLDYPESNVPWFHQKYIEENITKKHTKPNLFTSKIKEYLERMIGQKSALAENVVTPYGYEIDFVIYLNSQGEIASDDSKLAKRLAVLLIPEHAYTNKTCRLKGIFQLKRRHLEILGYKVALIRYSDWISLYYPEERIDFLRQLIWPKTFSEINEPLR